MTTTVQPRVQSAGLLARLFAVSIGANLKKVTTGSTSAVVVERAEGVAISLATETDLRTLSRQLAETSGPCLNPMCPGCVADRAEAIFNALQDVQAAALRAAERGAEGWQPVSDAPQVREVLAYWPKYDEMRVAFHKVLDGRQCWRDARTGNALHPPALFWPLPPPPAASSAPRCILCGNAESKHTKSSADWRTVPGCSKFTPPAASSSREKEV